MTVLRTPDCRFEHLPGYPFQPHYVEVPGITVHGSLRMHYLEEGSGDAPVVLLLHGEPSWSYLYRHMIWPLAAAGFRVLAPDLIGFGRSDKPTRFRHYSYQSHVEWMRSWLQALDLQQITMVCQDWGGLIGLRLLAEIPWRFARVVAANTGLPTGNHPPSTEFTDWCAYARDVPEFPTGAIVARGCARLLPYEVQAAYDAPFPDESYKAGARAFPALVPITPDEPAAIANRCAARALSGLRIPFLTAFSDGDPITRGADLLLQRLIPGAAGQQHVTIRGAGHFLQEDAGAELAEIVASFARNTADATPGRVHRTPA